MKMKTIDKAMQIVKEHPDYYNAEFEINIENTDDKNLKQIIIDNCCPRDNFHLPQYEEGGMFCESTRTCENCWNDEFELDEDGNFKQSEYID